MAAELSYLLRGLGLNCPCLIIRSSGYRDRSLACLAFQGDPCCGAIDNEWSAAVFASEKQITVCLCRVLEYVGIPHHSRGFEQPLYHTDLSHDVASDSKQMGHSGTK